MRAVGSPILTADVCVGKARAVRSELVWATGLSNEDHPIPVMKMPTR